MNIIELPETELELLAKEADLTPIPCVEQEIEDETINYYYFDLLDSQRRLYEDIEGEYI